MLREKGTRLPSTMEYAHSLMPINFRVNSSPHKRFLFRYNTHHREMAETGGGQGGQAGCGAALRLCGSLQVDIEKTRRLLGWMPPLSLDEGLRRAAGNTGLPRFARNDGEEYSQ